MTNIVKYTTPTLIFQANESANIDLTIATDVHVTFDSYGKVLDKSGSDVVAGEKTVSVYLTQEDTKILKPGVCDVMINWLNPDGKRGSNDPKKPIKIEIDKNLLDKVI